MSGGHKSIVTWVLAMLSSIEASGVIQIISGLVGVVAGITACLYYIEAKKSKNIERLINEEKLKKLMKPQPIKVPAE
ncbi:hypothetical protein JI57_03915 [Psychromonas sp. PRT-SC03]|nr:hypothetical protein JI57_03915 [Psychromonas sp. PRT-SC03]